MTTETIAFIGAGNMASAMITGLLSNGYAPEQIWASDPSADKLGLLQQKFGIQTTNDNHHAATQADIIILAVKPTTMASVCDGIKDTVIDKQPLIVSVAMGVTTQLIQQWLNTKPAIIRAMPNIPATVCAAASGLFANDAVSDAQKNSVEAVFRSIGVSLWVEQEAQLDLVCAISGSGPAYIFYIMEAIEQSAITLGLNPETASLLTEQTVLGAAKMALESGQPVINLRKAVTSPQGTTERAIQVLEQADIHKSIHQAITAAADRAKEVSQTLENQGEQS